METLKQLCYLAVSLAVFLLIFNYPHFIDEYWVLWGCCAYIGYKCVIKSFITLKRPEVEMRAKIDAKFREIEEEERSERKAKRDARDKERRERWARTQAKAKEIEEYKRKNNLR